MGDDDPPKRPAPKWLTDDYGNLDRAKRSNTHERRIAGQLGGKRIARSGAKAWSKWDKTTERGDIKTPDLHVEHKRTDNESMSIKKDWLVQVTEGAERVGKDPALVITFEDPTRGKVIDWILMPLDVAKRRLGIPDDDEDP